ncbi:MAG: hypothetical protein Q8S01_13855, partial [Ignavibacteria bacterium]|nr:hypothetical protein [Ignavibacteria bacterium]
MPEFINNQTPIDSILETNRNQDPYLDELKSHIENGNIPENTTLHKAAAKMLLEAGVIIDKPTLPTSRLENQTELDIDKLINKIENNEDYMFDSKEAKKLIETGNLELFYENIEKFKNLDE